MGLYYLYTVRLRLPQCTQHTFGSHTCPSWVMDKNSVPWSCIVNTRLAYTMMARITAIDMHTSYQTLVLVELQFSFDLNHALRFSTQPTMNWILIWFTLRHIHSLLSNELTTGNATRNLIPGWLADWLYSYYACIPNRTKCSRAATTTATDKPLLHKQRHHIVSCHSQWQHLAHPLLHACNLLYNVAWPVPYCARCPRSE